MSRSTFVAESFFSAPRADLFAFHERDDAFRLLTPDWAGVDVISTVSTLQPSDEIAAFKTGLGPVKFRFEMAHTGYEKDRLFVDEQRKGLFSSWRHEHRFTEAGWERDPGSLLSDRIDYAHPLLPFMNAFVRPRLKKLFTERHRVTAEHLHTKPSAGDACRTVVLTGATGLIGARVAELLAAKGNRVLAFVRDPARAERRLGDTVIPVRWDFKDPGSGDWRSYLAQADSVIHLAGTPLFSKRWSVAFKKEMLESRAGSTRQLTTALREMGRRPESFITASAVGIYGTHPEVDAAEDEPAADDLLARICVDWEKEARAPEEQGVRTAQIRIGVVLSPEGGALKEMLPLFRLGFGAVLGERRPWINWIHLEDCARIIAMAAEHEGCSGPVNAVAPNPARNAQLTTTLAKVLRRPALLRLPMSMLKLAIGEAGGYASGGARARSGRVESLGYRFFFEDLEGALRNLLAKPA
jgi:uncharacterized protein